MLFTFDGCCGFFPRLTLCRPAVTIGSSRPGVNHYYIKDRLGVPVTHLVYIEAPKASFQTEFSSLTCPFDALSACFATATRPFHLDSSLFFQWSLGINL